jgi:hypothetical protein
VWWIDTLNDHVVLYNHYFENRGFETCENPLQLQHLSYREFQPLLATSHACRGSSVRPVDTEGSGHARGDNCRQRKQRWDHANRHRTTSGGHQRTRMVCWGGQIMTYLSRSRSWPDRSTHGWSSAADNPTMPSSSSSSRPCKVIET